MTITDNIVWHPQSVSRAQRTAAKGHGACVLWYTGLSGAGKSTLANAVDARLHALGCHTYLLDGDNIRHGLNGDLGFSDGDRIENIRRIGEAAKLFADAGLILSTAFISPFRADRQLVRQLIGEQGFIEIFVDTPLAVCEQRDPKGLYKKAREGAIRNFTGIDSDYEPPQAADIHLPTEQLGFDGCVERVVAALMARGIVRESPASADDKQSG